MKLGLHIANFTWPGGAPRLGPVLGDIAAAADQAGFDRISVMDHLWQISVIGPPEHEMLEAYTTLGYLAGHTRRAKLLTLVTGVVYRDPGLLAKAVTTLDVLSGGRAMLGIGAAWNAAEARRRRCCSWPSTPTPATCSRGGRCSTSSTSCAGTVTR